MKMKNLYFLSILFGRFWKISLCYEATLLKTIYFYKHQISLSQIRQVFIIRSRFPEKNLIKKGRETKER